MSAPHSIVGHSDQCTQLLSDIETGNVAHAYLFSGKSRLGKITVAKWFAEKLLCHSCDDTDACRKSMKNFTHPDYLVLDQLWIDGVCDDWGVISKSSNVPQQHRAKAKPKTDTISIDDIRALQERLHETVLGQYRCCVIRGIERMALPAANAFLKILEEPPKGLVFLLTTEARSSLLPTIISRTRLLRFHPQPLSTMREVLPEGSDGQFIAHLAQGAPGSAISLRDDPDRLREQRLLHGKASSFWSSSNMRERIQILDPLLERGDQSDQFLLHLGLTLRESSKANQQTVGALTVLSRDLQTNGNRSLLVQRFALETAIGN